MFKHYHYEVYYICNVIEFVKSVITIKYYIIYFKLLISPGKQRGTLINPVITITTPPPRLQGRVVDPDLV